MWFKMIINVSLDEANKMQKIIERQKKKIIKLKSHLEKQSKQLQELNYQIYNTE